MTSLPKLVFSIILILVLIQSGHAKTSTENLIVNESDILELKKSTEIKEGDFVAITNVGAYGMSLSSNYNVRPMIAEVMVNNNKHKLIKKRQSLKSLINS